MPGSEAEAKHLIQAWLDIAILSEEVGNHDRALRFLGMALHATQDKWAHAMQCAGWDVHLMASPDDPHKHPLEYWEAYKDSLALVEQFTKATRK
jgi:hypothetical protein